MSGPVETFQIPQEAAEVYEAKFEFVPANIGESAPYLVEAAGVAPGGSSGSQAVPLAQRPGS